LNSNKADNQSQSIWKMRMKTLQGLLLLLHTAINLNGADI